MSTRLLVPLSAGLVIGSGITLYFNDPSKLHKRWNWDWDGRHSYYMPFITADPPIYPAGMRTITLIRHGQYNRVQGGINDHKSLTELGKKQAMMTGQRLKALNLKFNEIYSAEFDRAQETCRIIVNELEHNDVSEIVYDSDLNEGYPAMIEPMIHYQTKEQFMEEMKKTARRIFNGFKVYFHRRNKDDMDPNSGKEIENVLIVGHANVIRYYLARCMQFDSVGWARFGLNNCSISRVDIFDDGRTQVTHVGDSGHLPKEMLTNNWSKREM